MTKKALLFATCILFFENLSAQVETPAYARVAAQFEKSYNAGTYDSIFNLFSAQMQGFLPKGKTISFLTGLKTQAGQITKREFTGYENGTYATYKTNFERAVFGVHISLDAESKINGLFVKPFVENNAPKMERNITKLKLPFK